MAREFAMPDDNPTKLSCHSCGVQACAVEPDQADYPGICPIPEHGELLAQVQLEYLGNEQTLKLAAAASRTEAAGYCRETRVEEIMNFARRLGVSHLGIACCIGLRREAAIAADIFQAHGFTVSCVICKVGSVAKEELGLDDSEKIRPGQFEAMCNPIAQARLLAEAGTGLNVLIGLCVGHDSLFFRHSEAPVTVLVAKDRVTGHNPAAALYLSRSYYRKLREGAGGQD
jgi:uncharacterized metal-binding protein